MQTRRNQLTPKPARGGFTLIELLVVISIIATLMALILPAIQSARAAARNLECKNNLKNISLAAHNFHSAKRVFPALGVYGSDGATPTPNRVDLRSWVVELLPGLDRRDIADRWDNGQAWNDALSNAVPLSGATPLNQTYIRVLACPDDQTAINANGGLSYAANHGYLEYGRTIAHWTEGYLDWNGDTVVNAPATPDADNADADAHRDTGVFWDSLVAEIADCPRESQRNSHNVDGVYDGGDQTIMFTENVNSGGSGSWADPAFSNVGFVYMVDEVTAPVSTPVLATENSFRYPQPALSPTPGLGNVSLPNKMKRGPEATPANPESAAPNSNHVGGVNIAYASGAVGFVSDDIDTNVYARLVTPGGARPRSYLAPQDPLGDNSF